MTATELVIDVDVHLHEDYAALAPFAEGLLQRTLAEYRQPERWLDVPGLSPLTVFEPPLGEDPQREPPVLRSPAAARARLDQLGVSAAVLFPSRLLFVGLPPEPFYPVGLMRAYNRYLQAHWVQPERGLYGALLVAPQDPQAAAREIEAYAPVAGIAAVCLPLAGVYPLWGHRQYDPIYAAAQAARLPVVFQGATLVYPVFPYQLDQFDTALAKQTLARPLGAIATLVSLVTGGVFARFPDLRVVFTECGWGWLEWVLGRLDQQWRWLRHELPFDGPPSALVERRVYCTTQPVAAQRVRAAAELPVDRLLFASDWPHYDADAPAALETLPLTPAQRRQILSENARTVFRLER
jgi:predicted TIM-barrel fold metal-dependent hydrolase